MTLTPEQVAEYEARAAVFGPMLAALEARAERAEADRAELLRACQEAERVFREYGHLHMRKGTHEAAEKARINWSHADALNATIAKMEGRQ